MRTIAATLLACLSFSANTAEYRANEVASGFQIPWGIEFLDNQRVIVNQKNGTVSLLDITTGKPQKLFNVPDVNTSGQAGLLDVALAPNADKQNPQLFFTYSKRTSKGNTVALATAQLQNNQLVGWNDLFVADAITDTGRHYGSRLSLLTTKFISQSVTVANVIMGKTLKPMLAVFCALTLMVRFRKTTHSNLPKLVLRYGVTGTATHKVCFTTKQQNSCGLLNMDHAAAMKLI